MNRRRRQALRRRSERAADNRNRQHPDRKGYYIVAADGGVLSFGDAKFYGSTGGNKPGGHNLTGIAISIDANRNINGYWLVADDTTVPTFGDAPFWGPPGATTAAHQLSA